jgi:hypothetical protein
MPTKRDAQTAFVDESSSLSNKRSRVVVHDSTNDSSKLERRGAIAAPISARSHWKASRMGDVTTVTNRPEPEPLDDYPPYYYDDDDLSGLEDMEFDDDTDVEEHVEPEVKQVCFQFVPPRSLSDMAVGSG